MEQQFDRERRIGAALLLGFAAFVILALASFYFERPRHTITTIHDNIASMVK